jgi:ATP-binding protein involved in chromosome partitioning
MPLTKDAVTEALRGVPGPVPGSDLVGGGYLRHIAACDTYATVRLQVPGGSAEDFDRIADAAHRAVLAKARLGGYPVDAFMVEFVDEASKTLHNVKFGKSSAAPAVPPPQPQGHTPIGGLRQPSPQAGTGPLPGVRYVVAVGAGKGGVGKSTVALNLAVGLARKGHAVGLLDGDIYGPSMPTMLGLESHETVVHQGMLQPFYVHGVKAMTIGKLVEPDKPLIWRGPMAHGAFKQLTEQTNWGELDYLIIDLPPGTGDVSLTMAQLLKLTGAVVVCTPQKVAQDDASRAARMFQQLQIEVLGVVENMSYFVGDDGKVYDIFGRGGAEHMASRLNLPFLGSIPITMALRANSDKGDPTANFVGKDRAGQELSRALTDLVTAVEGQVSMAAIRQGQTKPSLSIS